MSKPDMRKHARSSGMVLIPGAGWSWPDASAKPYKHQRRRDIRAELSKRFPRARALMKTRSPLGQ